MARVTQNSKPTQSSSSTLSTHLFLEVPTLRSIPTKSQMLHCLIGLVVERVETNLPTSFFQVANQLSTYIFFGLDPHKWRR